MSLIVLIFLILQGCSDKPFVFIEKSCAIDSFDGINNAGANNISKTNQTLKVSGWLADLDSKQGPDTVLINLYSANKVVSLGSLDLNQGRPDVAKHFNVLEIENKKIGFSSELSTQNIAPGNYTVQLVAEFPDKTAVCLPSRNIEITP